jgi:hypothetical protein
MKKNHLSRRPTTRVTDLVYVLLDITAEQLRNCAVVQYLCPVTPNARREVSSRTKAVTLMESNKDAVFHLCDMSYTVRSQSDVSVRYDVTGRDVVDADCVEDEVVVWSCTCHNFEQTGLRCKHIW